MKHAAISNEKVEADTEAQEPGYAAWKRAKVERGLTQATDRSAMIPADQVLDALKLAR